MSSSLYLIPLCSMIISFISHPSPKRLLIFCICVEDDTSTIKYWTYLIYKVYDILVVNRLLHIVLYAESNKYYYYHRKLKKAR